MQSVQHLSRPTIWQLFRIWSGIGLQSFGGGASTLFLIQRAFVERTGWLSIEEFILFNNQCYFTPGINLIALTVLIGRKFGGVRGIIVSLAGMLLPSATITCLLTAGYSLVQHFALVQAVVKGVVPATAGLMLMVGLSLVMPQVKRAHAEGWMRLALSLALVVVCTVALIVLHLPVILVLLGAALLAMLLFTRWREQTPAQQGKRQSEEIAHD
ncbi:MAG: chromate transporter [Ktedonobacteraceae bacterium]|nr:chromate transporter [Ktedonobacteraceae bacterium]